MNRRTFCYPVLCVDQEWIRLDPDLVQMYPAFTSGLTAWWPAWRARGFSIGLLGVHFRMSLGWCVPVLQAFWLRDPETSEGKKQKFCHPEYLLRILETRKPTTRFDSYRAQYISMTENRDTIGLRRPSTSPAYVPKHVGGFRWLWWQFQPTISLCRDGL